MKLKLEFLKTQFKDITQQHKLKTTKEEEYGIIFENDKIELYFSADRWEDGVTLCLTDKLRNEFYNPDDLEVKKGFTAFSDDYLTSSEKAIYESLPGDDAIIYSFRVFLERHCQKELSGNFSAVMPGTKSTG